MTQKPARIERNAEESKKRILKAAESIFAARGFDGARVDEIASTAQINKRMIYHYFKGKQNLYRVVLRQNYQKIMDVGMEAASMESSAVEKVASFIRHYFYFLAENEEFVRLIKWESLQERQYSLQILLDFSKTTLPVLAEVLEEGMEQGIFRRNLDVRHLIISINALCMMYFTRQEVYSILWQQDMTSEKTLQEHLEHILDLTFNGILKS